jgi:hypothetical protein
MLLTDPRRSGSGSYEENDLSEENGFSSVATA